MSRNCIDCVVNDRTGNDLLCDNCRAIKAAARPVTLAEWQLEVMRRAGDEVCRLAEEYRRLAPRNGEIPVGGAHFDPWLRQVTLLDLLSRFRRGNADPLAGAKRYARECIVNWNARREWQVHRADMAADDFLEGWHRRLTQENA